MRSSWIRVGPKSNVLTNETDPSRMTKIRVTHPQAKATKATGKPREAWDRFSHSLQTEAALLTP